MKIATLVAAALLAAAFPTLSADAPSDKFNAGRHTAKGLPCLVCHGAQNEVEEPGIEQCSKCHQPDALAAKTEPKTAGGHNPHKSPHYQTKLECTNCHHGHEEPENFCNQCHQFPFQVK